MYNGVFEYMSVRNSEVSTVAGEPAERARLQNRSSAGVSFIFTFRQAGELPTEGDINTPFALLP